MNLDDLPSRLYAEFARIGQALADPTRLRLLNLLCQTERGVDDLAGRLGHSSANTSAHLKVLKDAELVERQKRGRRVFYKIAGDRALRLWLALRDTGFAQLPQVREAMRRHAYEAALLDNISGQELLDKVRDGDITVVDLRPIEEFEAGHIPRSTSIPFDKLEEHIDQLDDRQTLVVYCRGPYCVAAIKGCARLRSHGLDARRLPGGIADWRAAGLPVETRQDPTAEVSL